MRHPVALNVRNKNVNNHQKQLPIQETIFQNTGTVKFSACLRQKQAKVAETCACHIYDDTVICVFF